MIPRDKSYPAVWRCQPLFCGTTILSTPRLPTYLLAKVSEHSLCHHSLQLDPRFSPQCPTPSPPSWNVREFRPSSPLPPACIAISPPPQGSTSWSRRWAPRAPWCPPCPRGSPPPSSPGFSSPGARGPAYAHLARASQLTSFPTDPPIPIL